MKVVKLSQEDYDSLVPDMKDAKFIPVEPISEETPALVSWIENASKITSSALSIYSVGKKFIKIVMGSGVYAFIDRMTGDVLFPASWNAPTKHSPVRGNIFEGTAGVEKYSLKYLKH